jgi:DNA-binding winged helix-turn-helix (wHTH) protein
MRYRFGEHWFDTGTRELSGANGTLRLSPKVHALLEVLLAERPRVVPRDELHARLWPDVHVTDASLARVVSELRAALAGPAGDGGLIRTAHRVGYAFEGPVEAEPSPGPAASRVLVMRRQRYPLREGENVLGRAEASVVPIDSTEVSRRHCRIDLDGNEAWIEDLGSKNGTYLSGVRVTERTRLTPGDLIAMGSERLVFGEADAMASTETRESVREEEGGVESGVESFRS